MHPQGIRYKIGGSMAGILSGLKSLGLDKLDGLEIYGEEENKGLKLREKPQLKEAVVLEEKDFLLDKTFTCPVCDRQFTSKIMKTGKAKLIGTDIDLRYRYEGIDSIKYDLVTCPRCGYAALNRYFSTILSAQAKLVKENIYGKVMLQELTGETYSYEELLERYKLALVCAIVKRAKDSEKAYICLKTAWLLRGMAEELELKNELTDATREELKNQELEYIQNALDGFINAVQKENLPICGMDSLTIDYLIAALAYQVKRDDVAAKKLSEILVSNAANERVKNRARELKQLILERHKKGN